MDQKPAMADTHTAELKESLLLSKWALTARRYDELNQQLLDPSVHNQPTLLHRVNKERSDIEELAQSYSEYQDLVRQLAEADQMLKDPRIEPALQQMAAEEARQLQERRLAMEERAREQLAPKDPRDEKNTFVEIRAATGGEEAALFAGDLFRMYVKYAEKKRLRVEVVDASETGIGGFKEVAILVEGKGAYGQFRYESGVHRVQRVPATEASGRIHTSTVTVAVMPEVDEVEVQVDSKISGSTPSARRGRAVRV